MIKYTNKKEDRYNRESWSSVKIGDGNRQHPSVTPYKTHRNVCVPWTNQVKSESVDKGSKREK